jgi:hypothetical protein
MAKRSKPKLRQRLGYWEVLDRKGRLLLRACTVRQVAALMRAWPPLE